MMASANFSFLRVCRLQQPSKMDINKSPSITLTKLDGKKNQLRSTLKAAKASETSLELSAHEAAPNPLVKRASARPTPHEQICVY